MDIRQITPRFYAAPQITVADIPAIREAGVTLVLCNRPDEEVPAGCKACDIRDAVEEAGLVFVEQALTHQTMNPDVIARNRSLMDQTDGVVLAYCASGTRSTIAWALAAATDTPVDDIIRAAAGGGYDLRNLRPAIEAAAKW